jgi:hypothetical protein
MRLFKTSMHFLLKVAHGAFYHAPGALAARLQGRHYSKNLIAQNFLLI